MLDTDPDLLDSVHRCLAHSHRRLALAVLLDAPDGTATVAELVDLIDADPAIPSGDRSDVRIGLVHVHLPGLADLGFVEDDATGTVEVTPRAAIVEPYLHTGARPPLVE